MAEHAHLIVITTTDSEVRAEKLARDAVADRLAACAQIDGPITSFHRWDGQVRSHTAWRLTLKTTAAAYPGLEALLIRGSSYDTPDVITLPVSGGSRPYLDWVGAQTEQR